MNGQENEIMDFSEIIKMAREADMTSMEMFGAIKFIEVWAPDLQRFAKLVAAKEREACAKVCDDIDVEYQGEDVLATWCSRAIRARGDE